jgi:hypothetical protein
MAARNIEVATSPSRQRRLVWRPTPTPAPMASSSSSRADRRDPSPPRRHPRHRRQRCSAFAEDPASSPLSRGGEPAQPVQEILPEARPADVRPLCVVDRSAAIDQAEVALRCALFASVGGACPLVTPDQVRQAVAQNFSLAVESLEVAATEPEDFIVFLPDIATADWVFNGGAPLQALGFPLFFRQWTRVARGEAATLPTFIQVELHGIPAHAWGRSTAQQLLGGSSCWVHELHANTEARRDLSVFRLSTWCRWPDLIPSAMDLFIPDPAVAVPAQPPKKKGFTYPIELWVVPGSFAGGIPPPSSLVGPDQGQRHHRRRRRHHSSPPRLSSERVPSSQGPSTPTLVHARLRPSTCHMVSAHSPMACRASLAINAVPPKVVDASITFASLVPQTAAAAPCSDSLEDRCGTRDEEDPPESFIESETPPSSPTLCKEDGQTSGPPMGLMPPGPDWPGEPAGPVDSSPPPQPNPTLLSLSALPTTAASPRAAGSPVCLDPP